MKNFFQSKELKIATIAVGIILILAGTLAVGIKIGFHKARYSYKWGENYERNFAGSRPSFPRSGSLGPMMRNFEGDDFRNGFGMAGTVISIADNKLIVKDRDGKENTAEVTSETIIKKRRSDELSIGDIKTDERVVVMGKPDESGVVKAILIRIFEAPLEVNSIQN